MSYYAFAECNNFYVSCERLFNPGLEGLPVIVLSNQEGCIIELSQEAKQLGLKIGDAYSKIKAFCTRMKVVIYTANEKLYGDVSNRAMNLLSSVSEEIEVASAHEAFLKFSCSEAPEDIFSACKEARNKITKWVGIPLSIGLAPTKTLAKIANEVAKRDCSAGIFDLTSTSVQKQILDAYPLVDIWDIEPRLKDLLNTMGIRTAWEFCQMEPFTVRRKVGAAGERVLWELRGVSCSTSAQSVPEKNISYARSFESAGVDQKELAEAFSNFVSGACIKLKEKRSYAKGLFIFLEAVLDEKQNSRSHFSLTSLLPMPTNEPMHMIAAAKHCLNRLYSPTEHYTRCGVVLLDLVPEDHLQSDLSINSPPPKHRKLVEAVQDLNAFYDKNTLYYGTMGIDRSWKMKPDQSSSPEWKGLAFALAK